MHAQRQAYALRLASILLTWCAVLGFAWWSFTLAHEQNQALRPVVPDITPTALPGEDERALLLAAVRWSLARPTEPIIDTLKASLISPRQESRAATRLTMLIHRGRERLAMIDGRVFRKGDTLPDGRLIKDITSRGILLLASGQAALIPRIPPFSVRLEKAAETQTVANATVPLTNATVATPVQGGTMKLDAQQAMQLLKQLETMQTHAN